MTDDYLQVTTTTDSRREAAGIARSAVEERLAACAQLVGPITSTYWWEGEVETGEEWMVFFKTTTARLEDLAALIAEQHSYETPEIIATPVTAGGADYLDWVSEQTASDDDGDDIDDEDVDDLVDDLIDEDADDEDDEDAEDEDAEDEDAEDEDAEDEEGDLDDEDEAEDVDEDVDGDAEDASGRADDDRAGLTGGVSARRARG